MGRGFPPPGREDDTLLKKLGFALLTIFAAITIMFFMVQCMPGDPVEMMASQIQSEEKVAYEIAYERAKATLNYDPDVPLVQRYITYVAGIIRGNLGTSMRYHRNVVDLIAGALPWTFFIVSISLLLSFALGVLLGIYIAWRRSKLLNGVLIGYQSIFGAVPNYIIGYLLVVLFSVRLGWLPARGAYSATVTPGFNLPFLKDAARYAVLPILTYFLTSVSGWSMSMKANSLTVLGEDYMEYARVRGLPNRHILVSYLAKNALLPLVTSLAINFGLLFGGAPLVENMFAYPGVGRYLNNALTYRDYPLVQGMFFIIIVMVVLSSLVAEVLYKQLNPRLRESS